MIDSIYIGYWQITEHPAKSYNIDYKVVIFLGDARWHHFELTAHFAKKFPLIISELYFELMCDELQEH